MHAILTNMSDTRKANPFASRLLHRSVALAVAALFCAAPHPAGAQITPDAGKRNADKNGKMSKDAKVSKGDKKADKNAKIAASPLPATYLRVELGGHTSLVRSVAFTDPTDAGAEPTLISASDDKSLRIWDAAAGRQKEAVRFDIGVGEQGMLRAAAPAPTGRYVALAQKAVAPAGQSAANLSDYLLIYDRVQAAALPGKNVKVTTGEIETKETKSTTIEPGTGIQKTVTNTVSQNQKIEEKSPIVRRYDAGMQLLPALVYSPDGQYIAVTGIRGGKFCQVRVFSAKDGHLVSAFPKGLQTQWIDEDAEESPNFLTMMDCLAFSPDGTRIVTGNRNGTVRIFEALTGKVVGERNFSKRRPIRAIAWKDDQVTGGPAIALGVEDQLYIWNPEKDAFEKQAAGNQVTCLAMNSGGRVVAGLGGNQNGVPYAVMLWDRTKERRDAAPTKIGEQDSLVTAVALSADGKSAASADAVGRVYLWDAQNGGERTPVTARSLPLNHLRWSEDGDALAWTLRESGEKLEFAGGFDLRRGEYLDAETVADRKFRASADATYEMPNLTRETFGYRAPRLTLNNDPLRSRIRLTFPDGRRQEITLPEGETALCGAIAQPALIAQKAENGRRYLAIAGTNRRIGIWEIGATADEKPKFLRQLIGFEQLPKDIAISPTNKFVAAVAQDGTVRLWSLTGANANRLIVPDATLIASGSKPAKGAAPKVAAGRIAATPDDAPILSLFPTADGEWVAWNDITGYYQASARGDDLIGWQVSRGESEPAAFRTAFEMREEKYQEKFIASVFEYADLTRIAAVLPTKSGVSEEARVVATLSNLPRVLLQEVKGAIIENGVYVARQPQVTLIVNATSETGASLNDKVKFEVQAERSAFRGRAREDDKGGKGVVLRKGQELTVSGLKPGVNRITVFAHYEGKGESQATRESQIEITYKGPNDDTARKTPNLYVLSLGNKEFESRGLDNLRFTANDSSEVYAAFKQQEGRFFGNVAGQDLTNKKKDEVEAALAQMGRDVTAEKYQGNPDDLVVVFISSHGLSPDNVAPGSEDFYLACTGTNTADAASIQKTAVPLKRIADALANLKASNVVLMLDQCYAGGIASSINQSRSARSRSLRTLRTQSFITLAATNGQQKSYEAGDWQHGAFTMALLRTLRGELPRALSDDNTIPMRFAVPAIQSEVERMVRLYNGEDQFPIAYSPPGMDGNRIVIARIR